MRWVRNLLVERVGLRISIELRGPTYEFSILMKIQVSTHLVLTIENERCLNIYLIICIVHEFWTYLGFVCVCVCVWSHNPLCNNFCILVNNKTFHFKKYYEMKQYKINVSWYLHCKYRLKRNLTFFTSRKSSIIDTILNIWGIFQNILA